jgi:pimeloyl-ACP methyl ester carboxylesterase
MKLMVQGREAYVYTGGKPFDPGLPCVVFVHGAMADHGHFTLLARWFAHHGWAVLAPDLPGHMRSAGPAMASIEAIADWLLALLDAAGVQQAALAGHSLGSLAALEAAARAPERITRLAMLGTAVPMPVPQALLDLGRTDALAAIDRVVVFSHSGLAAKPSYPGPGVWLRGGTRALMRQVLAHGRDPLLFVNDFAACNAYTQGLEAAARVRCPAHLVLGSLDQMTLPKGAAAVAAALNATVHTLPAGHFLMQECPDGVLAALRQCFNAGPAGGPQRPASASPY